MEDSPALTACVACCVDAQKRVMDPHVHPVHGQKMDYNLYQRALRSLRKALNTTGGMREMPNLLATAIMHRLETFIVTRPTQLSNATCWSPHAGGISAFLQSFGPAALKDDLLFSVFVENYHDVVSALHMPFNMTAL
ncbi:hypothetical protein H2200_008218 [Cladophialophora chaetospira]|uniref:Uncharacterized protein n=1 Tax=Cladophialophora chaetospira TaxID=386627 RepID=A0AA38X5U1_9EURO|nr:hypothetical protein H2200_008218 [Cladophialophora chaetospira]